MVVASSRTSGHGSARGRVRVHFIQRWFQSGRRFGFSDARLVVFPPPHVILIDTHFELSQFFGGQSTQTAAFELSRSTRICGERMSALRDGPLGQHVDLEAPPPIPIRMSPLLSHVTAAAA